MVTIPTGTWVDGNVDAVELRKSLGASLVVPGAPTAPRPGRLAGPGTPLTVSPTAPASMAVLVKAGKAHTYRSAAYGPVLGIGPDGDVTIPIVAPSSGSQWYRIYVNQRDSTPPANDADSLAVVDFVAGTAAASPAKPNLPAGALLLGEVLVPSGATSITGTMVTDLPTYTAPRGGVLPVANQAERVALTTASLVWPTLEVLELDTGRRLWHDGTRFRYDGDRVTVANVAALDALTAYAGLEAITSDAGRRYRHDGTTWADPLARLFAYASVSRPGFAAGWQDLDLNAETIDTHGGHVTGATLATAQRYFTVPAGQAGRYKVGGGCVWGAVPAGASINARILKNNAPFYGSSGASTQGAFAGISTLTGEKSLDLAVGDTVHIQAYCSAGPWDTAVFSDAAPWMAVERID